MSLFTSQTLVACDLLAILRELFVMEFHISRAARDQYQFDQSLFQFTGNAVVKVAPTTDHDKLKAGINNLAVGDGTAKGEAIFTALDTIKTIPADNEGTPPPKK